MTNEIITKLKSILVEYNNLNLKLENLALQNNIKEITSVNIRISEIEDLVHLYKKYEENLNQKDNLKKSLETEDSEFISLIKDEIKTVDENLIQIDKDIMEAFLPKDENDNKNVIVEIRGAAGGDEANIFVGDIFDMYLKYIDMQGWKTEIIEASESSAGGYSYLSFLVKGKQVYKKLKYESGIHRVQRVPATESKGRVHTSTISVAILPEASDVDIKINLSDLKIDTYRASGAGGQHVNMTDSAVRITHLPTKVAVTSQDGRSQHDNKDKAMKVLRAKLYELELEKEEQKMKNIRSLAVGQGKRAEKIRTYNYPQNRITDHRINFTLNKLDQVMQGKMDELINTLVAYDNKEKIDEIKL